MENKIDFVITYVNGGDENWIEKKNKYLPLDEQVDARDKRYRDWDNLKYWFRGVEKFAPWVNKVFLVTDDQAPEWINKECEKLVLVNHEDFIPKEYLPVFSANPIELNLYRIKGLSEQFVFFNDDMFLTNDTTPEDFFKNGLPCEYAVENPLGMNDRTFYHIVANDVIFLNNHSTRLEYLKKYYRKRFSLVWKKAALRNLYFSFLKRKKYFGFEYFHLASPFLKSACQKVWDEDKLGWLHETSLNKFRSSNDVNQYVFKQYQFVNGLYHPYNIRKYSMEYQLNDSIEKNNVIKAAENIQKQKYKQVCINDSHITDFEKSKNIINDAFESILPEKSSFEK